MKLLMRRRDAADVLSVSESQVVKWEHDGFLRPIDLKGVGGIRAVRYAASDVEALARRLINDAPKTGR